MDSQDYILVLVGLAVIVKFVILDNLAAFSQKLHLDLATLTTYLFTWKTLFVALVILSPLLIYLNYRINYKIHGKFQDIRSMRKRQEEIKEEIEKALEAKLDDLDLEETTELITWLETLILKVDSAKSLESYRTLLKDKLKEVRKTLKLREEEKRVDDLHQARDELKDEIKQLEEEKHRRLRNEEQEKREKLRKLKTEENNVFHKDALEEDEIKVLLDSGYDSVTEYCLVERRLIHVLVKQIQHHTSTHTFLVWSLHRLLETIPGIWKIREHETKEADITFVYNKKDYALEVETGNLLRKKQQLRDKVAYLNNRYQNRWMFVVSNKELVSNYRAFGPATQRKEVAERLQKLLKSSTPF
jgi:hypothetical protein